MFCFAWYAERLIVEKTQIISEKLKGLSSRLIAGSLSQVQVDAELRAALDDTTNRYVLGKLRSAQKWTGIYFDARKSAEHGGRAKVRMRILQELAKAQIEPDDKQTEL